jgi:hypothetical protein
MITSRTHYGNPDKLSTCSDVQIARPAGRPGSAAGRLHTHRMGQKAFRNQAQQRALRPATYWRRRFLALVAGFGALSLVVWAFSGALAVGKTGSPAPASRVSSHPVVSTSPGAASPGSASPAASAPARSREPSAAARARRARARVTSRDHAVQQPITARRACRPADVVLSLFLSQDSYGPGQLPVFDVDVVSTSPRTCTVNVGPKFLAVVVTSGGDRIWSSADCVAGAGSLVTDLVKGVPAVLPISWGRQTSAPGCFVPAIRAHAGTYRAAAFDGRLVSRKEAFRIS